MDDEGTPPHEEALALLKRSRSWVIVAVEDDRVRTAHEHADRLEDRERLRHVMKNLVASYSTR